jgi:hypothetical protein
MESDRPIRYQTTTQSTLSCSSSVMVAKLLTPFAVDLLAGDRGAALVKLAIGLFPDRSCSLALGPIHLCRCFSSPRMSWSRPSHHDDGLAALSGVTAKQRSWFHPIGDRSSLAPPFAFRPIPEGDECSTATGRDSVHKESHDLVSRTASTQVNRW